MGIFILIFIGAIIFIIISGVITSNKRKERAAAMPNAAREMNFIFRGVEIPYQNLTGAENSVLFTSGNRGRHIYHLMTGTVNNLTVSVFDFAYTWHSSGGTNHSSSTQTYEQTVVMIDFSQVLLPTFRLEKKSTDVVVGFINSATGYKSNSIAFPAHPVFSQYYDLLGKDEATRSRHRDEAIHAFNESHLHRLFNETIISFYEKDLGLLTESIGNRLIFYRHNVTIVPGQLRNAVNEALAATNLFLAAGKRFNAVAGNK